MLSGKLDIYDVGAPVTVDIEVTRPLTLVMEDVPSLVQTTSLQNAIESLVSNTYSIKVSRTTPLSAGQAIKVTESPEDPSLVGLTLLVDKVNLNGAAMIRKAVATDFHTVDQQGKGGL